MKPQQVTKSWNSWKYQRNLKIWKLSKS